MEAQMERERPLVLCVVVLCCSAESLLRVSVNGGADGAGETPCIMCCCFAPSAPAELTESLTVNGLCRGAQRQQHLYTCVVLLCCICRVFC